MNSKDLLNILGEIDDKYILDVEYKTILPLKIVKIVSLVASICLVSLVILFAIQNYPQVKENQPVINDNYEIDVSLFTPSAKDPDLDFTKDPQYTPHIDVIINGNQIYTQISIDKLKELGFKPTLHSSDFGEYIGTVSITNSYKSPTQSPCSTDIVLANSNVYYYAPINCQSMIIVQSDTLCSVFAFDGFIDDGHNMSELYSIFGVKTSKDIESIEFFIKENSKQDFINHSTLTSEKDIKTFFLITNSLIGYKNENPHLGTPDWLDDALRNYDERLYIDITVKLYNGLSFEIQYQPNLGTGYIDGYFFLTKEQNVKLKEIFK